MKCEWLENCPFFNMPEDVAHPHAITAMKKIYCRGNSLLCARRQVANAVGREHVPLHLNPNHSHLVQDIIGVALSRR